MQIIQSIRDKGAAVIIAVIALSLIGFILMDAQQGGSRLFGSLSSNVGKVNGKIIGTAEFDKKYQETELAQQQKPTGSQIYQLRDQVWNQMVAQIIFEEESKNHEKQIISYVGGPVVGSNRFESSCFLGRSMGFL